MRKHDTEVAMTALITHDSHILKTPLGFSLDNIAVSCLPMPTLTALLPTLTHAHSSESWQMRAETLRLHTQLDF